MAEDSNGLARSEESLHGGIRHESRPEGISFTVGGVALRLFHAVNFPDGPAQFKSSALDSLFSFGKKRERSWYYAVLPEYVLIRAGRVVLKSKIHSSEGFSFIRVPHLGILIVEDGALRKALGGERALIEKKPVHFTG